MSVASILRHGYEQAAAYGAPGEMRNRLRLAAEYAETHNGQLPEWLGYHAKPKVYQLPVLVESEVEA